MEKELLEMDNKESVYFTSMWIYLPGLLKSEQTVSNINTFHFMTHIGQTMIPDIKFYLEFNDNFQGFKIIQYTVTYN